jgi:hypothetical protein
MFHCTFILSLAATSLVAADQSFDLSSPDGSVRFRLTTAPDGHLAYSVSSHGQPRLESAPPA